MKTTKACTIAVVTTLGSIQAQPLTSATFSNSDVTIYEESSPGVLTQNNSFNPVSALQGTANAAGGNIELFASSDLGGFVSPVAGSAFATTSPTVLTAGFSSGPTVTVSGLNGQDWFSDASNNYDTTFGASNLANQWFGDFLTAMVAQSGGAAASFISGSETTLFDTFRDNGGFAQLSDPNISYIDTSDSMVVSVGLGGFSDSTPRVASLLDVAPAVFDFAFQNGIQISEVVKINGEEAYSFQGVNSGVVLNDGVNSYDATYEVSVPVPEPSSSLLLLLAGVAGVIRRKR